MTLPTTDLKFASVEDTELQAEIRQAIAELDSGDCITLTPEQLERCAVYGESPWPDESLD
ncbi:hypothetical protein BH09MYX1_BH09MYX1_09440 [soil metagenome]